MDTVCDCTFEKLLLKPFGSLNFDNKKRIIEVGKPTPKLPYLMTKSKNYIRTFNYEY